MAYNARDMMPEIMQYINDLKLSGRTLDIGSFNVNGCIEPLFDDYIGMDMRQGSNVDIVANSHSIPFHDNTFKNVTALEVIEHDDKFWVTCSEIYRVLKQGGHVVITAPSINFPRHDYPSDYWRFTADGLKVLLQNSGFTVLEYIENSTTSFVHGVKGIS